VIDTIDAKNRPQRNEGFQLEELDGQLLLYHPSDTRILSFNETASLVWRLCDGKRTVAEIIDVLVSAFPDAADEIPADVETLLETLHTQRAIDFA
jgi:pyrroloquinoline quinone biosynthesis protein D